MQILWRARQTGILGVELPQALGVVFPGWTLHTIVDRYCRILLIELDAAACHDV